MKRIFIFLFLLLLLSTPAQAQLPANIFENAAGSPGAIDPPITADNCPEYEGFIVRSVTPTAGNCIIDEGTYISEATITNVSPLEEGSYYYCLKTNPLDCDDDDLKSVDDITGGGYSSAGGTGIVRFPTLCGDGDKKLKTKCDNDGSDWFHSGKTYRVSLFDKKKKGAYTGHEAAFYITHYYPEVKAPIPGKDEKLSINAIKNGNGYDLRVTLEGRNLRGKNADKYNDYFLVVEGFDTEYRSASSCLYVGKSGISNSTVKMPLKSTDVKGFEHGQLTEGTYLLKIIDGKDGNFSETNPTCNENDFVYYYIPILVGRGDTPGAIGIAIKDPKGKEINKNTIRPVPEPICPPEDQNEYGYCTKIPTALGIKINTEPQLFVRDIFTIVLSVGGIAATIFFIQAGYVLMTSGGNKEKVGAAREQITSAIMGLIFIILSITILEFIGVNILRIPGFGN